MEVNYKKAKKSILEQEINKLCPNIVLLVPDSLFWVTGRIATEISNILKNNGINSMICSGPVLSELLETAPSFVEKLSTVHFLTPHLATKFKNMFYSRSIFVSTIHHIENYMSIEPASYSDAVMTVSTQWHYELVKTGVSESKLVMIQNRVDSKLFRPVSYSEKQKIRKKFGLPLNSFIVGFSAKKTSDSCDRKGVDVLVSIIRSLINVNGLNISWFIRGPGWNNLVDSLQEEGAVIYYHPFISSDKVLAESYQALDAFVITSRIEGGPVTLLEAMSCELPVITTRVGVSPELVEDGINGFFVEFDAPEEILAKIISLVRNQAAGVLIGRQARQDIVHSMRRQCRTKDLLRLYSIAEENFRKRQNYTLWDNFHGEFSRKSFRAIGRWIFLRECLCFANFLVSQKAHKAASKMANRAILSSLLDWSVLKRTVHLSSLRIPFHLIHSVMRFLRKEV